MLKEDIENLNFAELNELEKQEYRAILIYNLRKLVEQLVNSKDLQLANLIYIATFLATTNPTHLLALHQYGAKLYETVLVEQSILQRTLELQQEQPEKVATEEFPPLDSEKEN